LVSALDAGTGKTLWSLDLKSNLLSGIGAEAPRAGQAHILQSSPKAMNWCISAAKVRSGATP
jgi:hypothetical protein